MTYPYVSGAVLLASDLNTDFAAKTDLAMTQNAQTGTTYSFALADASKLLTTSNASPVSVTVTKQATVTWVTGTQLRVMNLGAGTTTLVADTGVTINGNVALKQYQGGTLIRTASDVWLFVPTASSSGMDLITPTSVAGTGVTLSGGQVTFTAATSISVNGVFTALYENYFLVFSGLTASAAPTLNVRWRVSGADNATSNYLQQYDYASGSAVGAQRLTAQTNAVLGYAASTSNNSLYSGILSGPQLATPTSFSSSGVYAFSGGADRVNYQNWFSASTQFDGFSLLPSTGNVTGSIRIYGLRNS